MAYTLNKNVVNGHTFTISSRYDFANCVILGKGSYGIVSQAKDTLSQKRVAVKRIRPYAEDKWDAKYTLREILLMKLLNNHPNVISLYDLSLHDEKMELYMVMELMDCDLSHIIQSKQTLTEMHYKCFAKQILEGLKAMHSIGVIHRDLKPANILVSKDCQIRITDLGLARFMDDDTLTGKNKSTSQTLYVVTRWYRSPELLLSKAHKYDASIDMWSFGCIMAELHIRKTLFPGKSTANQVQLIFEVFGYQQNSQLGFTVSTEAEYFLNSRCIQQSQDLWDVIPEATEEAICFISAMLDVNPANRATASQALELPYLLDVDSICDYTKAHCDAPTIDMFHFEQANLDVDELKERIRTEVFHLSGQPLNDSACMDHNTLLDDDSFEKSMQDVCMDQTQTYSDITTKTNITQPISDTFQSKEKVNDEAVNNDTRLEYQLESGSSINKAESNSFITSALKNLHFRTQQDADSVNIEVFSRDDKKLMSTPDDNCLVRPITARRYTLNSLFRMKETRRSVKLPSLLSRSRHVSSSENLKCINDADRKILSRSAKFATEKRENKAQNHSGHHSI